MNVAPSLFVAASLAAFLIGRSTTPELPLQIAVSRPPMPRAPAVADVQGDIAKAHQRFIAAHVRSPGPEPDASEQPPHPVPLPPVPQPPRPRPLTPAEIAAGMSRDVSAIVYGTGGPELLLVDRRSSARRSLQSGSLYGSGWRFVGVENGYILIRKGRASQRIPIGLSGSNAATVDLPAAPPAIDSMGDGQSQVGSGAERPQRRILRRGQGSAGAGEP